MGAADLVVHAGYEALEASNAEEAIRLLEARTDIILVFTDVGMPGEGSHFFPSPTAMERSSNRYAGCCHRLKRAGSSRRGSSVPFFQDLSPASHPVEFC